MPHQEPAPRPAAEPPDGTSSAAPGRASSEPSDGGLPAGAGGESAGPSGAPARGLDSILGGPAGEATDTVYDERQTVRISASSAVIGVVIVALALLAERVFVAAHRPLGWALAAVVVAVLIDPIVGALGRHIPRIVAVIAALIVVGTGAFIIIYRAFDDLSAGIDRLGDAARDAAHHVEARDDSVGELARDVDASRRVDDFFDEVENRVTGGEDVLVSTAGTAPTYFVGAILTIFLMSYGPRLAGSALEQIPDTGRRERLAGVVEGALVRGRRAVLFTLGEGVLAGLGVGLTAGALGLPAPSALGLAVGIMSLLPHVGLVLGSVPFLLLMLGLRSDVATIALAVVMIALQLTDSLVIRPWIADRSVHIGLLVPWTVALVGYTVYGVGGAAYGLALAAFALAAVDEIERRSLPVAAPPGPGPDMVRAAEGVAADDAGSDSGDAGEVDESDGSGAAAEAEPGSRLPPAEQGVSG
jgi:predicted PurR-regulated permease PerM